MTSKPLAPEQKELLRAYLDGRCTDDECQEAEALLEHSPAAAEYVDSLDDVSAYTEAITARTDGQSVLEGVTDRTRPRRAKRSGETSPWTAVLVGGALCTLIAVILFPVFAKDRHKARQTSCLSNVRQIGMAFQSYLDDYGAFPDRLSWSIKLMPYTQNSQIFHCPTHEGEAGLSYAMNAALSGASIEDIPSPEKTILMYEIDSAGRPAFRHNDGTNVGFADGHAKWLRELPPDLVMGVSTAPGGATPEQAIVAYGASQEVWVEDLGAAMPKAEATVTEAGGFILASRLDRLSSPPAGQLVCRVPADRALETMTAFAELGWVASRRLEGEDLTSQYIEADRRLEQVEVAPPTGDASEAPVPASPAQDAQDAMAGLQSRVEMTTISLDLVEGTPGTEEGVGAAFHDAWSASTGTIAFAIRVCAWLISFARVWGPILVAWVVHRRRLVMDVPLHFGEIPPD